MSSRLPPRSPPSADKARFPNSPKRPYPLEWTRNIGIAAHIDAGKTTTTERILFYTGAIHKIGEVHEGTTVTDWMEQERERGITITSAARPVSGRRMEQASSSCRRASSCASISSTLPDTWISRPKWSARSACSTAPSPCSDAVAGVQPQSETVWRQANKYRVPRIAFINKMDRVGANFHNADRRNPQQARRERLARHHALGAEDKLHGQIDLVNQKAVMFPTTTRSVRPTSWSKSVPS